MPTIQNHLEIDELGSLFDALKPVPDTSLPKVLEEVVALAKHKQMSAAGLQTTLESYGIEATPQFSAWLEEQFHG